MTEFDYYLFVGLILTGVLIAAPIAYALGRYDERQIYRPIWRHVSELHRQLNHKSFVILNPRVGANRGIKQERVRFTPQEKGQIERENRRQQS